MLVFARRFGGCEGPGMAFGVEGKPGLTERFRGIVGRLHIDLYNYLRNSDMICS